MISNWLSAALARRNIHYGWAMVGVTFLTALISAGTVGAPGVFIVPLQNEFGWTTAEISSALSIRFILFGLMAPFAAALLNRYGLRNVTLSALLVVASGLVASLFMTQVWQLMLLWGVVIGLGTGMTALVLGATIAARWFAARRGLVVGHSHRQRRHRPTGVPAAAGEPYRTRRLADGAGPDLRDARGCGLRGAFGDVRSSERSRAAAVRR
jgi:MFS family permease